MGSGFHDGPLPKKNENRRERQRSLRGSGEINAMELDLVDWARAMMGMVEIGAVAVRQRGERGFGADEQERQGHQDGKRLSHGNDGTNRKDSCQKTDLRQFYAAFFSRRNAEKSTIAR